MKAVFPVNGLGTRFLPATKAVPKEMLPVVDKPLIQYAVEEAAAAGITEMIFVTAAPSAPSKTISTIAPNSSASLRKRAKRSFLKRFETSSLSGLPASTFASRSLSASGMPFCVPVLLSGTNHLP